jgi:hypothetical protein
MLDVGKTKQPRGGSELPRYVWKTTFCNSSQTQVPGHSFADVTKPAFTGLSTKYRKAVKKCSSSRMNRS